MSEQGKKSDTRKKEASRQPARRVHEDLESVRVLALGGGFVYFKTGA